MKIIDYHQVSDLTEEILKRTAGTFLILFGVFYVFYKSFAWSFGLNLFFLPLFLYRSIKVARENRLHNLLQQFYVLLQTLLISMEAGEIFHNALGDALVSLKRSGHDYSLIIREVELILEKARNNVPLSKAWQDFARRSNLPPIVEFARVYELLSRNTDQVDMVLRKNIHLWHQQQELQIEVETILWEKRLEQKILIVFPVVLIILFRFYYGQYTFVLDNTVVGKMIITVALLLFALSYIYGEYLVKSLY